MITFSSGLHFGIIVTMISVVMFLAYEVFNVLRLSYAEYKYNKEKPIEVDFSTRSGREKFFNETYKKW
jgi:hypothetical protein